MQKRFYLRAEQIKDVAVGYGACIASDRITVDGRKVGLMYRSEQLDTIDSGWRFLAGDESDDYMDDTSCHGVYDVNTIANIDPDIVKFLHEPLGTYFERDSMGDLRQV